LGTYILRRALINIPVIWLVATLVFFATSVLPGDFVAQRIAAQNPIPDNPELQQQQLEAVRADLGLNDSVGVRYLRYIGNLAKGDFGTSFETRRNAIDGFKDGIPYTAQLGIMTLIVAILTSVPIGIISAIRQDTISDYSLRVFAIVALAAPNFWVATMLLLYVIRGVPIPFTPWEIGWEIDLTSQALLWEDPIKSLKLFALPAIAGGIASGAGVMRLLRSQMLEVLRQDYIRTAWAKGLRERGIIVRHALKNAMIPVLTVLGLQIGGLIGGNVVFEFLFNIPGVGNKILRSIQARDVPVVQSFILVIATFIVFVNLAVDVMYSMLDPRIRFS
jgi:peptide/nickel transport system permease protein